MGHIEQVILVDENDKEVGLCPKLEAHQRGLLHRAFSIFIFNSQQKLMLQRRQADKYHSAGLWTNTCCSHPRIGETLTMAAQRRLREEMGFEVQLKKVGSFIYHECLENGLVEHEFDHVFVGYYDEEPEINPEEVGDWCWVDIDTLKLNLQNAPQQFTAWFSPALAIVLDYLKSNR